MLDDSFRSANGFRGENEAGGAGEASLTIIFLPFLHEAGELALDTDFRHRVHAVDEENAVEVVDLVLEGARQKAVGFHGAGVAVEVQVGDLDGAGAADVTAQTGEGEAALLAQLLRASQLQFRVHEHDGHVLHHVHRLTVHFHEGDAVGIVGDINDRKLEVHRHLRSGQADAVGLAHGVQHVGGKSADLGGDFGHETALGTEHGLGVADDFADH